MRRITVYPRIGNATEYESDVVWFKPSPALTEVTIDGVRRFFNTNGEPVVLDEPVEEK